MNMLSLDKPTAFFAIALLVVAVLALPQVSHAFFSNTQSAPEQRFAAGSLALMPPVPEQTSATVYPDSVTEVSVGFATVPGSVPAHYDVMVSNMNGNGDSSTLCSALRLNATSSDGVTIEDMPAGGFASESTEQFGTWTFGFFVNDPTSLDDESACDITFTVETWQENMVKGVGFVDTATFTISVEFAADNTTSNGEGAAEQSAPEIIINELNWAGSDASGLDQWIELHNPSAEPIDISGWELLNAKQSNGTSTIPQNSIIDAGGYFLIARFGQGTDNSAFSELITVDFIDTINLTNTYSANGAVVLRKPDGTVVDQTPPATTSSWPAGENTTGSIVEKWSMQRGENPGDGADAGNWYTCDPGVLFDDGTLSDMQAFWLPAHATSSCGTPRHENLSSNDPTKLTFSAGDATTSNEPPEAQQSNFGFTATITDESIAGESGEIQAAERDNSSAPTGKDNETPEPVQPPENEKDTDTTIPSDDKEKKARDDDELEHTETPDLSKQLDATNTTGTADKEPVPTIDDTVGRTDGDLHVESPPEESTTTGEPNDDAEPPQKKQSGESDAPASSPEQPITIDETGSSDEPTEEVTEEPS